MAFTMLFLSCTKDLRVADAISKADLTNIQLEMINGLELGWESMNTPGASLESIIDDINDYGLKEHGETIISHEEFMETYEHYLPYITEDIKQENMFDIFFEEEKLSKEQYELLVTLDQKMTVVESDDDALAILEDFEESVRENIVLDTDQKNQLLIFSTSVESQYEFMMSMEDDSKSPCTDCLKRNKWKIFGWSAAFLVIGLILCVLGLAAGTVVLGPLGPLVFWHCVAAIGISWAGVIIGHCPICVF